jgi:hypothetical protein
MARPLRVEFDGALYHVISRGNAQKDIFDGDGDGKTIPLAYENGNHLDLSLIVTPEDRPLPVLIELQTCRDSGHGRGDRRTPPS